MSRHCTIGSLYYNHSKYRHRTNIIQLRIQPLILAFVICCSLFASVGCVFGCVFGGMCVVYVIFYGSCLTNDRSLCLWRVFAWLYCWFCVALHAWLNFMFSLHSFVCDLFMPCTCWIVFSNMCAWRIRGEQLGTFSSCVFVLSFKPKCVKVWQTSGLLRSRKRSVGSIYIYIYIFTHF